MSCMIMILSSPFTYLSGGERILWNGTVAVDLRVEGDKTLETGEVMLYGVCTRLPCL